jgi:hypothetical protein
MSGSQDDSFNKIPPDPMTVFAQAAVQLHEAYLAYTKAGFTDAQALTLTQAILTALIHTGTA